MEQIKANRDETMGRAEAGMMVFRAKVAAMNELLLTKEAEIYLSKTDREWLEGISGRVNRKLRLAGSIVN
jgi:hypothetical protein